MVVLQPPMIGPPRTITPPETTRRRKRSRSEEEGLQRPVEEDAFEENGTFTPAVLLPFQNGDGSPLATDDILIVAPYNAQVSALAEALPDVSDRIGTVDRFQGQEAPVVIYSMTSSSPEDAPRGMEFLYNRFRFNGATSRARALCILVGSPALFEPECRTPHQMRMANGLCRFLELSRTVQVI